jgi:hypothetical protein
MGFQWSNGVRTARSSAGPLQEAWEKADPSPPFADDATGFEMAWELAALAAEDADGVGEQRSASEGRSYEKPTSRRLKTAATGGRKRRRAAALQDGGRGKPRPYEERAKKGRP